MRLAIFGGSFDPPHKGHEEIINKLDSIEWLDKIVILPTYRNPFKKDTFFSPKFRFKCLEMMTKHCHKTIVSSFEIFSQRPISSLESVLHFKEIYKPERIYLVIGADIVPTLHKWHRIEDLRNEVKFIVAKRDDLPILIECEILDIDIECSSSAIQKNLKNSPHLAKKIVKSQIPISISSEVQKEFAKMNKMERKDLEKNLESRVDAIVRLLDDKKAEDIVKIDLRESAYITSFVIIATSLADKHSFSLLDYLKNELKPSGEIFYATDEENGDWIIADLGDIMVHIFTPNHRKKFNLEEFLINYSNNTSNVKSY